MTKAKELTLENLVNRLGDLSHGSAKKIENWFDRAHFKLTKAGFNKVGYGTYRRDQFTANLKVAHGPRSSTGQIIFKEDSAPEQLLATEVTDAPTTHDVQV